MEKAGFDTILRDLKARKFAPVYFLCGEEAYFIDLIADYVQEHVLNDMEKAFNLTVAYGKDVNARQIVETCGRLPMMAEKQVVIVREAQALSLKEEEEKQYLAYLKNPVKSTILVFAWKHGTPDGRKAFSKEVKKTVFFESKPLYEDKVAPWIKNWVSDRKYKIDEAAASLIVEYAGTELSKVANELEKLILNKQPGATITVADIELMVGISKDYNAFELNNAIGARNHVKTYRIVSHFVANPKNGPLVVILGALYGFFTKVYQYHYAKSLPDREIASVLKINPYFMKDYKVAAQNYPLPKLERAFNILEEYDLRSKGVNNHGVEEGELLREMVYRIMN